MKETHLPSSFHLQPAFLQNCSWSFQNLHSIRFVPARELDWAPAHHLLEASTAPSTCRPVCLSLLLPTPSLRPPLEAPHVHTSRKQKGSADFDLLCLQAYSPTIHNFHLHLLDWTQPNPGVTSDFCFYLTRKSYWLNPLNHYRCVCLSPPPLSLGLKQPPLTHLDKAFSTDPSFLSRPANTCLNKDHFKVMTRLHHCAYF